MTTQLEGVPWVDDLEGDAPVTYTVDGLTFGDVDRFGNYWHVDSTEGWHERPDLRNNRQARADGHGANRSPAWRTPG